jgi:hypothetical protein
MSNPPRALYSKGVLLNRGGSSPGGEEYLLHIQRTLKRGGSHDTIPSQNKPSRRSLDSGTIDELPSAAGEAFVERIDAYTGP